MLFRAGFMRMDIVGGTKFTYRKCHIVEKSARIFNLGLKALFIGHAVFGCIYEILRRSYYADYRKDTDADCKVSFSVLAIAKTSAKAIANALGNLGYTAATATIARTLFKYGC